MKTKKTITPKAKRKRKVKKWKPKVKSDLHVAKIDNQNGDFDSVMNYNSHFTPHITKDIFKAGYKISNGGACGRNRTGILLTILVISAPEHFKQRQAIRESWGDTKLFKEVAFSFFVGLSENASVMVALEEESKKYGDSIINNNVDLYQNLALKSLSALSWIKQFCRKSHLLKVDDDMFVQVERVLELIQSKVKRSSRLILGNISRGWKPVRNPRSKYLITEAQYGKEKYPDFATGPSYLVTSRAMTEMISVALEQKYIHLEDVFLTGVVAELLGITRVHVVQFKNNASRIPVQFMGCTLEHTITIHKVDPEEQSALYKLATNPDCGNKGKKLVPFIPSKGNRTEQVKKPSNIVKQR